MIQMVLQKIFNVNVHLAHQISCLSGILCLTITNLLIWKWLAIANLKKALFIGFAWLIATAIFETFILNRKLTTTEIFQTYDLAKGEFWGLVLVWIGLMPMLIFSFKAKK